MIITHIILPDYGGDGTPYTKKLRDAGTYVSSECTQVLYLFNTGNADFMCISWKKYNSGNKLVQHMQGCGVSTSQCTNATNQSCTITTTIIRGRKHSVGALACVRFAAFTYCMLLGLLL